MGKAPSAACGNKATSKKDDSSAEEVKKKFLRGQFHNPFRARIN